MILSEPLTRAMSDPNINEVVQTIEEEYDGLEEKETIILWHYSNHELTAYDDNGIILTVIDLEKLCSGEDSISLELFSINNNLMMLTT